jgi:hypothetical protein
MIIETQIIIFSFQLPAQLNCMSTLQIYKLIFVYIDSINSENFASDVYCHNRSSVYLGTCCTLEFCSVDFQPWK